MQPSRASGSAGVAPLALLVLVGLRESLVAELEALEVLLAGVLAAEEHLAALVEVVAHRDLTSSSARRDVPVPGTWPGSRVR